MRIDEATVRDLIPPKRELKFNRTSQENADDFLRGVGIAFPEGIIKRYTHDIDRCVPPGRTEI
jgi:hypothetical protein